MFILCTHENMCAQHVYGCTHKIYIYIKACEKPVSASSFRRVCETFGGNESESESFVSTPVKAPQGGCWVEAGGE